MAGGYDSSVSEHQPDHIDVQPSGLNLLYAQWYASDTPPKTFSVSCTAANGKAINSPKSAASSKTVNLYKPKLPTPKIGYSCEDHIDRLLIPATETSLAVQTYFQYDALWPVDFDFWVDVVDGPAMPDGTKWKLDRGNGSYLGTVGGADTSANTDVGTSLTGVNIGALTDDTGHPKTSREISVIVEHPCYESSASVPMKFKLYLPPPSSIATFYAEIDCDGVGAGDHVYEVSATTMFQGCSGVSLYGAMPDADDGAQFDWYVKVDGGEYRLIKTEYSPDNINFSMADAGINFDNLVSGVEVMMEIKLHISFPGTTVEADSDLDSTDYEWLKIRKP